MNKKPILVIIGSTATGKSKLAIELALKFNGEIISADSMQLYKGLDIVSNKVTKDEQEQVKHHLLNVLEPTEVYTVSDFKRQVDNIIKEIHNQNKLPIIVGGTYYYIESILYDKLIDTESSDELTLANAGNQRRTYTDEDLESLDNFFKYEIKTFSFDNVDSVKLHNLLKQVDLETANRLHPNDKRKIVRALQVYQKTNKKYSDLIKEQHKNSGTSKISGQLIFKNSLILNLNINKTILHDRIDKRVDEMLRRGLMEELNSFYELYNQIISKSSYSYLDYRKGIFQIIGFKEFNDYFNYIYKNELNGKKIKDVTQLNNEQIKNKLIEKGLNNLKQITKKYSKTQTDWFNNRILSNINKRSTPPIFNLNVDDLDKWNDNVLEPSIELVDHFLIKEKSITELPDYLMKLKALEIKKEKNEKQLRYCKYCDKNIVDDIIWTQHINSKGHQQNKKIYNNNLLNKIDYKLISKVSLAIIVIVGFVKIYVSRN